ncbi:MAG: 1-(5-phosphoribosyl)-5-((5-phosphoribosylamino)methylideneamino)imidazole-4-carboxamide isomerase, partial [Gammaproteobacteria bacterium]|nr:1-(5-phosphoribosyl)-5-((5-phosphoribosylamino)methylideneamino)imidazole-4-carboxamide isomerase [Gammaproteobacteria bacterium]NIO62997.1 1-(5-phosphoribosyl)-5-((5-phosphoribosylamino)methylideneamino)imidazole-4-carboxamide isomerase [Gammaproteobacteria bacterium]NIT40026.1 1-(5-phosphoribosyl)-5-((5-phosphoribosylamino)methylideneamino)imidazole-4-carboxamide isomerase [Gammaproteobacteria bacterium]
GKVATEGWSKLSHHDVVDMAQRFEEEGVAAIIYTDIGRDGMMNSVNIESTVAICKKVKIPVIASGGISNLD